MKKFNDFMYDGPRWKVALFTFSFFFTICFLLFVGIEMIANADDISILRQSLVSAVMSGVFTLLIMSMISIGKQSQKFWDKVKEVELFINEAETLEELKAIYEGEFTTLKQMSLGTPHRCEIIRLITIIDTKANYLK